MTTATDHPVRERTWTKEEYYRLGELGFFRGQRVELLEGVLMVMSPQGAPHGGIVHLVTKVLEGVFLPSFLVRAQLPLDVGATTEPEPDIAVVQGTLRQFVVAHPTRAALIVEVSDTTLAYDRGRKASLYASAGIRDYWISTSSPPRSRSTVTRSLTRPSPSDTATPFAWIGFPVMSSPSLRYRRR